ncbi:hypothetical protein NLG97_g290 [Lecanicillium saksenae]|uniref:Uncharacterized protein n=2 Tax=Lecanicillium saksenae TaxID=468837 RepID=A0ACC1R8X7_9HYPO|nr:hypothetical protein NLG97_g2913 [Lecanicillium saksenae]KAJ3499501.1 hypothetical protein NLG97_g290 [Lecanicillium saksenae]
MDSKTLSFRPCLTPTPSSTYPAPFPEKLQEDLQKLVGSLSNETDKALFDAWIFARGKFSTEPLKSAVLTDSAPQLPNTYTKVADTSRLHVLFGQDVYNAFQRYANSRGIGMEVRFTWSGLMLDACVFADVLLKDDLCIKLFPNDHTYAATEALLSLSDTGRHAIDDAELRKWEKSYGVEEITKCVYLVSKEAGSSTGTLCFRINPTYLTWINSSVPVQLSVAYI